jgi:hypothetical protein
VAIGSGDYLGLSHVKACPCRVFRGRGGPIATRDLSHVLGSWAGDPQTCQAASWRAKHCFTGRDGIATPLGWPRDRSPGRYRGNASIFEVHSYGATCPARGGGAGLILLTRAVAGDSESIGVPLEPAALQAQATVVPPRYVYGSGAQGFGYYTAPAPQPAAAAPRPAAPARSSVGPGVRNWSTGRRSPLHRPWMRPM